MGLGATMESSDGEKAKQQPQQKKVFFYFVANLHVSKGWKTSLKVTMMYQILQFNEEEM